MTSQVATFRLLSPHALLSGARLNLLYFLIGWADGWTAAGRVTPSVHAVLGELDRPKRAAWIVVEGDRVYGQLTVWESGECEIEAQDIESGAVVARESGSVSDESELARRARDLIARCE